MHVLEKHSTKKRSSTKLSQISIQKEHIVGILIEYSYLLKLNTGLDPLPLDYIVVRSGGFARRPTLEPVLYPVGYCAGHFVRVVPVGRGVQHVARGPRGRRRVVPWAVRRGWRWRTWCGVSVGVVVVPRLAGAGSHVLEPLQRRALHARQHLDNNERVKCLRGTAAGYLVYF